MVKTIDYYSYWNKNRPKNEALKIRELASLRLIESLPRTRTNFLDAGCGNGKFMLELKKRCPYLIIKGVDYSKSEVAEAREKGLNVAKMDFENGIAFNKDSFDIIYAGELIEHLFNPDLFFSEVHRVLNSEGYLIITTPNLCAWFNRLLMLLGIQPLFIETSTKSKLVGAGFLSRFKSESQPVGHVRIFTFAALRDILKMNGFKIIKVQGNPYQEGFPKKLLFLDKIFASLSPTLGGQFIILAQKVE